MIFLDSWKKRNTSYTRRTNVMEYCFRIEHILLLLCIYLVLNVDCKTGQYLCHRWQNWNSQHTMSFMLVEYKSADNWSQHTVFKNFRWAFVYKLFMPSLFAFLEQEFKQSCFLGEKNSQLNLLDQVQMHLGKPKWNRLTKFSRIVWLLMQLSQKPVCSTFNLEANVAKLDLLLVWLCCDVF